MGSDPSPPFFCLRSSQKILQLLQYYVIFSLNFFPAIIEETSDMVKQLRDHEIIENLSLLADWLRVKYPGEHFELVVAGGSAMMLDGFKDQTTDIDLLRPEVLPSSIKNGIAHIGRVRRLGPEWLNTSLVNMLLKAKGTKKLPEYFYEISRTIEVADNLQIGLVGRQALISLKMYAATPIYRKHTVDIKNLGPSKDEISEAVRFVMNMDNSNLRKDDLRVVLKDVGFDFDEILRERKR
jgi:hypothetical protein